LAQVLLHWHALYKINESLPTSERANMRSFAALFKEGTDLVRLPLISTENFKGVIGELFKGFNFAHNSVSVPETLISSSKEALGVEEGAHPPHVLPHIGVAAS
jgi:hypothetical protein